jgi:hypothetical protein
MLDIGGMLWEGDKLHDSAGEAMDDAERFIAQWRKENSTKKTRKSRLSKR